MQQEDRGIGASDSLVNRIMVTSPDDNHVIITMPTADGTRPASYVSRNSQNSSNEDAHAAPSDSAYSADAMPPSHVSQPQFGAGHDSSPEQWQQQQQQVACCSRSYADMGRQRLQKQPGQKQPKNESASEHLPESSSDPAERQASLQTASATRLSASINQSNNSEFGHSPELGGEDLMRNQQFDALQEQLHGLVQASQGVNESLLHVHQQLESLKSK